MDGLIREFVREEVYYREGMALGLNRNDTVIRRRLKQKLEFVAEADGLAAEPSDDDLRAFLEQRGDAYRTDSRVSFVHVFLSAERRGDDVAQDAAQLLAGLQSSDEAVDPASLGDPSMLERQFEDVPLRDIAAQFGEQFADRVAGFPVANGRGRSSPATAYTSSSLERKRTAAHPSSRTSATRCVATG